MRRLVVLLVAVVALVTSCTKSESPAGPLPTRETQPRDSLALGEPAPTVLPTAQTTGLGESVVTATELLQGVLLLAETPHRFELRVGATSADVDSPEVVPSDGLNIAGEFDGSWSLSQAYIEGQVAMAVITNQNVMYATTPVMGDNSFLMADPMALAVDGWVQMNVAQVLAGAEEGAQFNALASSFEIVTDLRELLALADELVEVAGTASRGSELRAFQSSLEVERPFGLDPTEVTVTIGIDDNGWIRSVEIESDLETQVIEFYDIDTEIGVSLPDEAVDITAALVLPREVKIANFIVCNEVGLDSGRSEERSDVVVIVDLEATSAELAEISSELDSDDDVATFTFVDTEGAFALIRETTDELMDRITVNDVPAFFRIAPIDGPYFEVRDRVSDRYVKFPVVLATCYN